MPKQQDEYTNESGLTPEPEVRVLPRSELALEPHPRTLPRPGRAHVRRDRLLRAIDAALEGEFVIIRGAAGTGKTNLMHDWIQLQRERGVAPEMIELLPGEQLAGARAEVWGRCGVHAPYGRVDIARRFSERRFLVIDEFDHVDDAAILADIAKLIEDSSVQVIVAQRSPVGFESRFGRQVAVGVIDPELLAFTQAEICALVAKRGATVEAAVLPAILDSFGGWARGVATVVGELALERSRVWRASEVHAVTERVRRELLAELTQPLQAEWETLVEACLLPFVSIPLLAELHAPDPAGLLARMEAAGIGAWRRVRGHDRYEILPVLRATARTEFSMLASSADRDQVDRLTALLIDAGSHPWDSIRLAAEAAQWASVARLLRDHYAVVVRDHAADALAMLQQHPVRVGEDPWLAYLVVALGVAAGRTSAAPALGELRRIDSTLRGDPPLPGQQGALDSQTLRCLVARQMANFGRAETLARTVAENAPIMAARGQAVSADIPMQVGITFLVSGAMTEALAEFVRVRTRAGAPEHLRLQATGYCAMIHALAGDIRAARHLVSAALHGGDWPAWRHSVWATPLHTAAALVATETSDWARAARHLRVLSMVPIGPDDWPFVSYAQAWTAMISGDGYRAFSIIRDAEGHHSVESESNFVQALLSVIKADSFLMARQIKSALTTLRPFLDGRDPIVGPYSRALLLAANPNHARVFVDRGVWRSRVNIRSTTELQLVRAIASSRLGDVDAARAALQQALALSERHELSSPWWLVPRDELVELSTRVEVPLPAAAQSAPQIFDSRLTVPVLTKREAVVLRLLREPGSIEWIASQLGVSANTVKSQVQSVYRKLGVKSRADAVRVARDWQLLDDGRGRQPER